MLQSRKCRCKETGGKIHRDRKERSFISTTVPADRWVMVLNISLHQTKLHLCYRLRWDDSNYLVWMKPSDNPPPSSLKQMSPMSASNASQCLLWMTGHARTPSRITIFTGARAWSVPDKKKQTTAWWAWSQMNNHTYLLHISISLSLN